jgi:hypothetical protein
MSLAPSERRALARIEESLRTTDRKLAGKLATFNALASRHGRLRWKWLSPWRLRLRRIIPMIVALAAMGIIVLAATVFSHSSPPGQPLGASHARCGTAAGRLTCQPAAVRSGHKDHSAG